MDLGRANSTRKVHMTTRDPRTGRWTRVPAEAEYAGDSKFNTVAREGIDVGFQGADPADPAYDAVPRHGPEADQLAESGSRFPLHPRHHALVSLDEEARTRYGTQGMLTRDAARLHGLTGALGYVLGIDDAAGPPRGNQEASDNTAGPRTGRRLPTMYGRPDVNQSER
jgi:hypothetical protein